MQEVVNRAGKAACVNGEWTMDIMYKTFSPDVLQTEIDTC